jgi:hypothetical protein
VYKGYLNCVNQVNLLQLILQSFKTLWSLLSV